MTTNDITVGKNTPRVAFNNQGWTLFEALEQVQAALPDSSFAAKYGIPPSFIHLIDDVLKDARDGRSDNLLNTLCEARAFLPKAWPNNLPSELLAKIDVTIGVGYADFLKEFPESSIVSEHYDVDPLFGDALNSLLPNFEYPNYAHRTIGEIINIVKKKNALAELLPHELTSAEFREIARTVKLENHGRQWEVFVGEKSLGFCDAPTAFGALNEAHAREVNNALYSNSPDAPGFMEKLSMPTERVLVEYPKLRERFAGVLMGVADKALLDQSFSRAVVGPSYAIGQKFEFKPGDQIVGNGYRGTVQERYSGEVGQPGGMVNVRLPGGSGCISASFPDCYPAVSNGVEVVTEGRHSGSVEEVTDQFVTQNIGRGKLVAHPVGKFDVLPQVGEEIDVQYKGDKAVIVPPKVKDKGNER